ncbi:hypothetical protein BCD64_16085 [Nostoc sp. MBR 210]|nr:hypothetical protein BCD64_16085 [Nostoc sp. MBR 210]
MNYPSVYISEQTSPINLTGDMGQAVQISIHAPSQYICTNCERILPDWKQEPFFWVVIVLQRSQFSLVESTKEIEAEKQKLRQRFMGFGCDVAFELRDRGYLSDLIDPRTGYPLLSRPGAMPHNDTAVVKALLGYPVIKNKCCVLLHPSWGTAVYPSILISAAPPTLIEFVVKEIACQHGWEEEV